ncbi:phosphatidylglycerophosphatase A [Desulfofarcimen acetoxidans DSM 771]|uniref:Phosphatidylglycerophosphatase A n=1 Tax=Desulfofarcimen acetoxidans (strain ATCC 49208 / DSM 771 / KCTC 5769 / VKM B-1644 / 5575) TaxID=485916 RepID=C8W3I0_DESAS|nr:phosphatidylglycerophosphatase A [Desulfofarcimen acetoxidans]ACV63766.1 phosphatidylglycerophosphatase A [Desulfofarcimen acetoxidans DSM 771]
MRVIKEHTIKKLQQRGVFIEDMAPLVMQLQRPYIPGLTLQECLESILAVLNKRDFQHTILTGIAIDELAEKNLIEEPLLSVLKNDDGLYGVDEILALGAGTLYGTIGSTNFGFLDKTKPGIIGKLDTSHERINIFLDDLVCAIIAAAASRVAHKNQNLRSKIE